MNHNETMAMRQTLSAKPKENLRRNLRQALKIINAEYQHLDWEDQAYLTRVLIDALENLEAKEASYARS